MSEHDRYLCEACRFTEYQAFADKCVHEAIARNEVWNADFGGFDMPHWNYSDEKHTLSFSEEGQTRIVCDAIIAGTTKASGWQWSWGNKGAAALDRNGTRPVLDLGEEKQWPALTSPFLSADEYTGWECTSIASHLLEGQATHRFAYGDDDEYFAYLMIMQTHRVA